MAKEHLLFITGRLAEASVRRTLADLGDVPFTHEVAVLGVSVAALMTTELIGRRLPELPAGIDRVVLPGRCRGALETLTAQWGVPVERGPEEIKDLPEFFGRAARKRDLSQHHTLIFAEVVDAPDRDVASIVARASYYRDEGADVIDLGCLPETPFAQLEDAVKALKAEGFKVSVDSLNPADLELAARAGADYLLSLTDDTLHIAQDYPVTPILIGSPPTDLDALCRTIDKALTLGITFFADPILDPIHFGFAASITRYVTLRERYPEVPIMMGIGNLTELTHADTTGMNALLMGLVSELNVGAILTTEVSAHCRTAVREVDLARRIMFAAREDKQPPKHVNDGLNVLHDLKPFPYGADELLAMAAAVKDPNYRIHVSDDGIHLFNRDVHVVADDPYDFFPKLAVEGDAGHAFYLGLELARAQVAHQLGKRYQQDEELRWGHLVDVFEDDKLAFAATRSTLEARRAKRAQEKDAAKADRCGPIRSAPEASGAGSDGSPEANG